MLVIILNRGKEERNILNTTKRKKANRIGRILRRNCLANHLFKTKVEESIELMGRRGRRRQKT
jgi:hypothetical protein